MTTENQNPTTETTSPEETKARLDALKNAVMKARVTGFCTLRKASRLATERPKDFSMVRIEDDIYLVRANKRSSKAKEVLRISDPGMAILMADVEENKKRLGL